MEKYYIKSVDWEKIYSFLKSHRGIRVGNEEKTRVFAEGVYFIMRTGAQWRELPAYYGKWRSVHKRFEAWSNKGLWSQTLEHFTEDYDGESVMIDATIVRAHPCASGYEKGQNEREGLGRSKGGFTTKIHAVVDALGQALKFSLTPGQRHDITQASSLLQGFENANIIADKGYDSNALTRFKIRIVSPLSRLVQIEKHLESMMKISIKSDILWSVSSTKSNSSGGSSHVLIRRLRRLWGFSLTHPLYFGSDKRTEPNARFKSHTEKDQK